ncbi:MAG: hypothetical protein ACREV1_11300, partial [Gammaproteobacteria bacterium]
LQLGMWEEAAKSNEGSWAASKKWVEKNSLSIAKRDYHSLHWLLYTYLQQGRHDDAEALLKLMQKSLGEGPKNDPMFQGYGSFIYAGMASAFVIETERWELADKLFAPLRENTELRSAAAKPGPFQALAKYVQALAIFTPGFSAAKQNSPGAQKSITELQTMREQAGKEVVPILGMSNLLEIQRLEIAAAASAAKDDFAKAIKTMQKATAAEESHEPPPGPPPLIKPTNELLGEILLLAKRPKEAREQFKIALLRHEDRAHALIGAARANARSGNGEYAADAYAEFVDQWQGDPNVLREARDYLTHAR